MMMRHSASTWNLVFAVTFSCLTQLGCLKFMKVVQLLGFFRRFNWRSRLTAAMELMVCRIVVIVDLEHWRGMISRVTCHDWS